MIDVSTSIIINRPIEDVFAHNTNPATAVTHRLGVESIEFIPNETVHVGTIERSTSKFMGFTITAEQEIIECAPPNKLTYKTLGGPLDGQIMLQFAEVEGGTEVRFHVTGEVRGVLKPVAGRVSAQAKASMDRDLNKMKELLEG